MVRLRRRLGISQEELAFRAEVHRTYISQLERGLKSPTLNMILKLSRALKALASKLVATGEATVALASRTISRHPIPGRLRLINLPGGLLKYISLSEGGSLLGFSETDGFIKPLNPLSTDLKFDGFADDVNCEASKLGRFMFRHDLGSP